VLEQSENIRKMAEIIAAYCNVAVQTQIYTVPLKRDLLFLTITLATLNRFLNKVFISF